MQWFKQYKHVLDDMLTLVKRGKIPKAMKTRPLLMTGLEFYLNAYEQLKADRPIGLSVGHIPYSSITTWCHINKIRDINEIDKFIRYIRAIEKVELDDN